MTMNHPEHTDHNGHAPATTQPLFPEAEWEQMMHDDRHAGGAVLLLMTGIFTIGLFLYLGVAIWVGSTPMNG
jgi:hypothetical protein